MSNVKEMVKYYLTEFPETRERKLTLITKMWADEATEQGVTSLDDFLSGLRAGEFSHPETIRRHDMKIKNEHPELQPTDQALARNSEQEAKLRAYYGGHSQNPGIVSLPTNQTTEQ